jgi:hypothetical protein
MRQQLKSWPLRQCGRQLENVEEDQRTGFARRRELDDAGNRHGQKWGVADAHHRHGSLRVGDDPLVKVRRRPIADPERGQLAAGSARAS